MGLMWRIRQTLKHKFTVQNTSMFGDVTMFGNDQEVEEFIREHSSPLPMSNRSVIYSANNPFRIPRPVSLINFLKSLRKADVVRVSEHLARYVFRCILKHINGSRVLEFIEKKRKRIALHARCRSGIISLELLSAETEERCL